MTSSPPSSSSPSSPSTDSQEQRSGLQEMGGGLFCAAVGTVAMLVHPETYVMGVSSLLMGWGLVGLGLARKMQWRDGKMLRSLVLSAVLGTALVVGLVAAVTPEGQESLFVIESPF